jgi:hypothetical protein
VGRRLKFAGRLIGGARVGDHAKRHIGAHFLVCRDRDQIRIDGCRRLAGNRWREQDDEQQCARRPLPCGPYLRFHQARSPNSP